jgi:eukaryotic-like serine/threonine-protein kinase
VIGQTISHYRITGQLGKGGMGVVYEAQDLTLGRRVALKFLPPELARGPNALDRFLLEARAASALNHPNICTIYAIENDNGQPFIAMELLEGQSLDRKLNEGPLTIDRLLHVSIQLADALDAAHSKGIVHRDIKPGNIFLTTREQVKILDFGLAKLTRTAEMATETVGVTADSPAPAHLTSPGSTVGTVAYMSPEQARGEELDARSDLFSLGAVIYQITTRQLPFPGNTSAMIFHAILERDPVSAAQINPAVPPKLQEIIDKLLEKDRDLRYQSAADLRSDLKRLKRDTESRPTTGQPFASSGEQLAVKPEPTTGAHKSSGSTVVAVAQQHKIGAGIATLIAVAVLAAATYGVYTLLHRSRPTPFQNISIAKVTQTGKASVVAISPDARYILYVLDEGQQSLWLRNIPTSSDTQVIAPASVQYQALRFSPDGNYLYFTRSEPGSTELKYLYRAPVLGGMPTRLVTDIDSNVTFSPDGRRYAFVRYNNPEAGKFRVIVLPVDGGEESVLYSGLVNEGLYDPAWSPDGKRIVFTELLPEGAASGLVTLEVSSGKRQTFYTSPATLLQRPLWMPDGSGVAVLSGIARNQIAYVSYPDGKLSAITRDTNNYSHPSLSADGRTLAAVSRESHFNLFSLRTGPSGASQVRQLTSGAPAYHFGWTRDSQILRDSPSGLSLLDLATGKVTLLPTPESPYISQPSACGDGRYITFTMVRKGTPVIRIWRMDAAGGNLKQLTDGKNQDYSVCSPDGRWVVYEDGVSGGHLMKIPISGGNGEQISQELVDNGFDISPDSKLVVFASFGHLGEHIEGLHVASLDTNQVVKTMKFEHPRSGPVRFAPDGKAVVYPVRNGSVDNLWMQPLDDSPGKQITNFSEEHIIDFHWSLDGKQLALIRGHTDSDVVLIRDSQM